MQFFKNLLADESGATAIEYALIILSIGVLIVGAVSAVGEALIPIFEDVEEGFTS